MIFVFHLTNHEEMQYDFRTYALIFTSLRLFSIILNTSQHHNSAYMGEHFTERIRLKWLKRILTFQATWFDKDENPSGTFCCARTIDGYSPTLNHHLLPHKKSAPLEHHCKLYQGSKPRLPNGYQGSKVINLFDGACNKPQKQGRKIELRKLDFAHSTCPDKPILKEFSLEVKPGTSIGLVGKSGCRNSIVTALMHKFYDVQRGPTLPN
ncbi:hypothetical protein Cgig2_024032 [Carnegiea gigantea]|uniref:ABC transmembrane type-1 domain-containing protein n=1 Tax=Carnegiea gigantea TaxID=171969 RepID=A0A9Q1KKG9_9CARY|nr:hypothetical protein Cgig2_024032 [Carnegiea gigantea]